MDFSVQQIFVRQVFLLIMFDCDGGLPPTTYDGIPNHHFISIASIHCKQQLKYKPQLSL